MNADDAHELHEAGGEQYQLHKLVSARVML